MLRGAVAAHHDLTADRCGLATGAGERHGNAVAVLLHAGDGRVESDVTADGQQRFPQPGHELVLGIDEVRTAAGQRAVVEDDALAGRAELTAAVLRVEK